MFIIANAMTLICYPLTIAAIINTIQQQGITRENIGYLIVLTLIIPVNELVFWCLHGPARVIERNNAFRARAGYRKYLLWGVLTCPMQWHVDHHSGDTIDKVEKGTQSLYAFSSESFQVLLASLHFIVGYGMLTYFNPLSSIIVAVMIAITIAITMQCDKVIINNYKSLNKAENQISAGVYDIISNITTIVTLRIEKYMFKDMSHMIDEPFPLYQKNSKQIEVKWFLVSMCCSVMEVAVIVTYLWKNLGLGQVILMGNIFLLLQYLERVRDVFFRFTNMYGDIIQRKTRMLNSEELSTDFRDTTLQNNVLPKTWKTLRVEGLSFSYHGVDHEDLHLDNLSFTINRGQRIAIVGESGGGKSTIFKIMAGLYEPTKGKIVVDENYFQNSFSSICRDIALVPQAPEIFATTIRKNITMGVEASDEKVIHYSDIACFTEVARKLPHGFESSIKEKGVNLSVGQQQRLALARGLFVCDEQKSIILLDEPTSSLDSNTEYKVYSNIFKEFERTSIISSIHRLHLLPLFDIIYVFDQGKIVGSGRIDDLVKSCPKFSEMWANYQRHKGDPDEI